MFNLKALVSLSLLIAIVLVCFSSTTNAFDLKQFEEETIEKIHVMQVEDMKTVANVNNNKVNNHIPKPPVQENIPTLRNYKNGKQREVGIIDI
ncbi:hypothetical protein ABK040_006446 [Willaertia magna]